MSRAVSMWLQENLGIAPTGEQLRKLEMHKSLVLAKNEVMNLTAITDDWEFDVKHIIDSLALLPLIPHGSSVVDVGTGAGFPGVALKIMRSDISVCLMDSRRKKVDFLREVLDALGISDAEFAHARSEEWAKKNPRRFDICTARAVAELGKLAGYALPLLKPGGLLLAMKGPDIADELAKAEPAIKKHGGSVEYIKRYEIDEGVWRSVVAVGRLR